MHRSFTEYISYTGPRVTRYISVIAGTERFISHPAIAPRPCASIARISGCMFSL